MKPITLICSAMSLAALGLGMPLTSVAQEEDILEEIVVTATRMETDLMSTSIAVSAFSQEQLTRDGIRDIRDASDLVPNFDVAFSPSDSGVQLTMRGINSNNFTEIGDPSVAFHVCLLYTSPSPRDED